MSYHNHPTQIAGFMLKKLLNKPESNWVKYYYEERSKFWEDIHWKVYSSYIIMIASYRLVGWQLPMDVDFDLVARVTTL